MEITIPKTLISFETLLYVGLSSTKATELWDGWTNWPTHGILREVDPDNGGLRVTFYDWIIARLRTYPDESGLNNDSQWRECMTTVGLDTNTQDAIMDPAFKNIRLTQSCIYWVRDTIRTRFMGLKQEITCTPTPGISPHPWNSEYVDRFKRDDENQVVLFKAVDLACIKTLLNPQDGSITHLNTLLTQPPTDFEVNLSRFHFAKEHTVAEYFAGYAKRRAQIQTHCNEPLGVGIGIVVLTLPKNILQSLKEPSVQHIYYPTPEWKLLIHNSKLRKDSIPKPLRKYRDAMLIIGHMTTGSQAQYEALDTWEDINDEFTLRVPHPHPSSAPGNPNTDIAVQYAFGHRDDDAVDFIKEHGKIEVFRFSDVDLENLLAKHSGPR